MARTSTVELTSFVALFNAFQLQPSRILDCAFQANAQWMTTHLGLSPRRLLAEHQLGFVVQGVHLAYEEPFSFYDADTLEIRTAQHVRKTGAQIEIEQELFAIGRRLATLRWTAIPLWVGESFSHAGVPSKVEGAVLARYQADEVDASEHVSPIPQLADSIQRSGELLAETRQALVLHRHSCEFADQWFFSEVARFIGSSRESLALAEGKRVPRLRQALSQPLRQLDMLFLRPGYLFDTIAVETQGYAWEDRLVFLHRLLATGVAKETLVSAVERF